MKHEITPETASSAPAPTIISVRAANRGRKQGVKTVGIQSALAIYWYRLIQQWLTFAIFNMNSPLPILIHTVGAICPALTAFGMPR